jgi:hypothetical protein
MMDSTLQDLITVVLVRIKLTWNFVHAVAEAGHILGLRLPEDSSAKAVLSEVFRRVAAWKMVGSLGGAHYGADMDNGDSQGGGGHFDQFDL